MTDYLRARYALEAEHYAQQAADQTERIIIDAINGRYDDLWLLVPDPVSRGRVKAAMDAQANKLTQLSYNLDQANWDRAEAQEAARSLREDIARLIGATLPPRTA